MSRPAFKPTQEQRDEVMFLASIGTGALEIARAIGISLPTLRKYFRLQIEFGPMEINARVEAAVRTLAFAGDQRAISFLRTHRPAQQR